MNKSITLTELKSKIDNGDDFALVETLPIEYYRHTHLPGAINLPLDKIKDSAASLLPDKDADIVVYCAKDT
jgi:rhodanese-related sulfurtransferase